MFFGIGCQEMTLGEIGAKFDLTRERVRQIKEKEYAAWLEAYTGEILLVGINYDKKDKVHKCIIEKYVKS